MIISLTILFLCVSSSSVLSLQRSDCVKECNHYEDTSLFDSCIRSCSKQPRKDNVPESMYYPPPPSNVSIYTEVVLDNGKFLETTIQWDVKYDPERTGFYLRYNAIGSKCQADFPGYFNSKIGANERIHHIPVLYNQHPITVEHGCTYQLEMHSKPYPNNDPMFTTISSHTVPQCIDKYCACQEDAVPLPTHLSAKEVIGGVEVEWKHLPRHHTTYTFYITLHERFRPPITFSDPNAFKFRIADGGEHEITGSEDQSSYLFFLEFPLKRSEEYKISIFAQDSNYCHNNDSYAFFNTSSIPSTVISSAIISDSEATTVKPAEKESNNVTYVTATVIEYEPILKPDGIDIFAMVESSTLIPILFLLAILSPVCSLLLYCLCRRRRGLRKRKMSRFGPWTLSHSRHSILETNILYRPPVEFRTPKTDEEWLINRDDISVGGVIGEGAFGLVCKGKMRGPKGMAIRVAMKQLKTNAVDEEREEFHREIEIMKQVGRHTNIVTMYGYCVDDELQCMVMEYIPFGDLKHYLQNLRKQLSLAVSSLKTSLRMDEAVNSPLSMQNSFIGTEAEMELQYTLDANELQSFAAQVASGMAHLEGLSITHRDLAARNILVGENKQLKISDFGMSRPGVYVKMSKGVIPLRWLSPEAIKDNLYSTKSDVWAYGIVLWEIVTLGGFPYPTICDKDLLQHLLDGNRLDKPISCSDEIYTLMIECWRLLPANRPSFSYLCDKLGALKSPYVDFPPNTSLPPHDGFVLTDSGTLITDIA